jgi:hypothetical protein
MKCAPPEGDPFSFDGPEIYRCKGMCICQYIIPLWYSETYTKFYTATNNLNKFTYRLSDKLEAREKFNSENCKEEAETQIKGKC